MGAITAIVIALFWNVVALLIVGSRGYTLRGMLLCVAGIIGGGMLAGVPGAYVLTDLTVVTSTQREAVVACAAVFIGALCGLYLAERLRERQFPTPRQILSAALGLVVGGLGASIIYAFTVGTWAHSIALYGLVPATIGTASLAGSALAHRMPDLK